MLTKFKMPLIEVYERRTGPRVHLETYVMAMQLHGAPEPITSKAFPITPEGTTRAWYHQMKPGTVASFEKLA